VNGTAPAIGKTAQFFAIASMSDGIAQGVTEQARWQSSSSSVATVTSNGLVTAVSTGDVDITASYQNATGSKRVTIAGSTIPTTPSPSPTPTPTPSPSPTPAPASCPNPPYQWDSNVQRCRESKTGRFALSACCGH
jgi:hypothetical protein